jgi:hypothetical protein
MKYREIWLRALSGTVKWWYWPFGKWWMNTTPETSKHRRSGVQLTSKVMISRDLVNMLELLITPPWYAVGVYFTLDVAMEYIFTIWVSHHNTFYSYLYHKGLTIFLTKAHLCWEKIRIKKAFRRWSKNYLSFSTQAHAKKIVQNLSLLLNLPIRCTSNGRIFTFTNLYFK